jgi:hypothetical protein
MTVNNFTRQVGGVFHGAVEVCGREYSFGYCETGSGVYECLPMLIPAYSYREKITMKDTEVTKEEVHVPVAAFPSRRDPEFDNLH